MTVRIAIAGAAGRMGRALLAALPDDMPLAGASEQEGAAAVGAPASALSGRPEQTAPVSIHPAEAAADADVWVDFTTPAASLAALSALLDSPVSAVVLGTTGFSADEENRIRALSGRFAIVKSGNFSIGVNLMLGLVETVAARLGEDWDVEILETHHRRKADAPSGTALMVGEAAARGRGAALDQLRAGPHEGPAALRRTGAIGFAVRRAGGVVGEHEASFTSEREQLVIGHRALDRSIFADGALRAARWVLERPPGLYSMQHVLGLAPIRSQGG